MSYTVTYNGNGNTGGIVPVDNNLYASGSTCTVFSNVNYNVDYSRLLKTIYSFKNWNTASNGTGDTVIPYQTLVISGNVTLYAQWFRTYTQGGDNGTGTGTIVFYNGVSNTSGNPPIDSNNPYNDNGSLFKPRILGSGTMVKTGHTFGGWVRVYSAKVYQPGEYSEELWGGPYEFQAQWIENSGYTVTYNGNGNTGGTVPSDPTLYASGSTVTVLGNTGNLKKNNGAFWTWNTSSDGNGINYIPGETFAISENRILYAIFNPWFQGPEQNFAVATDNTYVYSTTYDSNHLLKIKLSDKSYTIFNLSNSRATLTVYNGYIYALLFVSGNSNGIISKLSSTDASDYTEIWATTERLGTCLTNYNGYIYVCINGYPNNIVVKIDLSNPSRSNQVTIYSFSDTNVYIKGIVIYNNFIYLYVYDAGNAKNVTTIRKLNLDGTLVNLNWFTLPSSLVTNEVVSGLTVLNGWMYATSRGKQGGNEYGTVSQINISDPTDFTLLWLDGFDTINTIFAGTNYLYFTRGSYIYKALPSPPSSSTTYTVTYEGNGSTSGTAPNDPTLYASGSTVTVLGNGSLAKNGYTFSNWNTAANGSGTSYVATNQFTITENSTLYAQWTSITYTVIYEGNGSTSGTAPVDTSSPYASGSTVTVLGNGSLQKNGYTFYNWNTAANGSGTSYAVGSTFTITADKVLYAQWTSITYTVTYEGNGSTSGTAPVDTSSPYASGSTVTVLGNGNLEKSDYTFSNWNTAANGSGTSYAVGSTFTITADKVLYAQWTSITYTVTYNGNGNTGGTAPVDTSSPYASGSTVTVLTNTGILVKNDNTFSGWNTAANGSGTDYIPLNQYRINSNVILYAKWITGTPQNNQSPAIYTEPSVSSPPPTLPNGAVSLNNARPEYSNLIYVSTANSNGISIINNISQIKIGDFIFIYNSDKSQALKYVVTGPVIYQTTRNKSRSIDAPYVSVPVDFVNSIGGSFTPGESIVLDIVVIIPFPPANICFPAGTPIKTDQGIIAIELISPGIHTIDSKPIINITRTITSDKYLVGFKKDALGENYPSDNTVMSRKHKVLYKGQMREAKYFLGKFQNKIVKVKYGGDILYNVLMEDYSNMNVNNLICATLNPNNIVAKLYMKKYSDVTRYKIIVLLKKCIQKNDYNTYNKIMQRFLK